MKPTDEKTVEETIDEETVEETDDDEEYRLDIGHGAASP